jgi:hypothetical protein
VGVQAGLAGLPLDEVEDLGLRQRAAVPLRFHDLILERHRR